VSLMLQMRVATMQEHLTKAYLVWEAESRLDIRAHVREHGVLDVANESSHHAGAPN
jgi:hypothetical protein